MKTSDLKQLIKEEIRLKKLKNNNRKNYLVVDKVKQGGYIIADDLNELIRDIYEFELEGEERTEDGHIQFFKEIKKQFFRDYEVFVSESEIVKLTKD